MRSSNQTYPQKLRNRDQVVTVNLANCSQSCSCNPMKSAAVGAPEWCLPRPSAVAKDLRFAEFLTILKPVFEDPSIVPKHPRRIRTLRHCKTERIKSAAESPQKKSPMFCTHSYLPTSPSPWATKRCSGLGLGEMFGLGKKKPMK